MVQGVVQSATLVPSFADEPPVEIADPKAAYGEELKRDTKLRDQRVHQHIATLGVGRW